MLIGIVGKPSSGKSTFLNAACLTNVKTANYPFTTIDPNLGKSFVRIKCACIEYNLQDNPKNSECKNGNRFIPIKLLDVAGLVPDAHKGKGMGNKFLSELAKADALIHVVDFSGSLDAEGQDLELGQRDPIDDIKFLEHEINHWFKGIIIKNDWNKFVRKIDQEKLSFGDLLYERMAGLSIRRHHIQKTIETCGLDFQQISTWSDGDILHFASILREISKPIVIAANKIDKPTSEQIFNDTKRKYSGKIIPCSGLAELWLRKYDEQEIITYLPGEPEFSFQDQSKIKKSELVGINNIQEKILTKYKSTGIQDTLNYTVFELLNQIVVYPVYDAQSFSDKDGNVLPDAHLVTKGIKIKEFVRQKIHSDLADNFIYAIDARTKMRLGESYELKNNDIIRIVTAAKSK